MDNIVYVFIALCALIYVIYKLRETPAKKESKIKKWTQRMEDNERRAKELGLPIKLDKQPSRKASATNLLFTSNKSTNTACPNRKDVHVDYECEHGPYGDCDCHGDE